LSLADSLLELQELTRRLRRDCPWDREQTARTIVPHTVEEAYEVADAALAGQPEKLLDELGDLLFQVYFLALLLEEQGQGDLFVEGTAATAGALARAQVAILLIAEVDPDASPSVWIGPDGTQLAGSREDVTVMGVDEPVEAPAVDALARAAVATDALLRVTGDAGFADGVGALLRWRNEG